jgi:hypothetical protein
MTIHRRSRLRAAVAICTNEIEGCDTMFTESTFERNATILGFGCVISHTLLDDAFIEASMNSPSLVRVHK